MKLSVIVPQYKETIDQMRPLLDSLYGQAGIDREDYQVVIVNDGVPEYKPDIYTLDRLYKGMNIKVMVNPVNGGCGPARQWGVDHTESDYVTFADADDQYMSCFALVNLLEAIEGREDKEPVRDMVFAPWVEEQRVNGQWIYYPHPNDMTWMHAKIYRREFLEREEIRFRPDFRVQEDSYFNTIAMCCGYAVRVETEPLYLWKWNDNSTTRANNAEYTYKSFIEYMEHKDAAFELLCKKQKVGVCKFIVDHIVHVYLTMTLPDWNTPEHKALQQQVRKHFGKFLRKYRQIWENTPREAWEMEWKLYIQLPQFDSNAKPDKLFELLDTFKDKLNTQNDITSPREL